MSPQICSRILLDSHWPGSLTRCQTNDWKPIRIVTVDEKVMLTMPLSVMNVTDGMCSMQVLVGGRESAANEASAPTDYVVSG